MIWFTSDQHFWHANVIEYCNRPFSNVDEMDEALISSWNKSVMPDDLVYHLGDFTLGNRLIAEKYFKRLNGYIRVLEYPWHHDKRWLRGQMYWSSHEVVYDLPIVVLEHEADVPIILCHYAFEIWDRKHYGSLHFHGHSHGELHRVENRLDVGVDNAYKFTGAYRPFSLEEAVELARSL
jgi:calcineurin-like phosphoesterase family protein